MPLFPWDDKLITNYVKIDNDHKKLVDLINKLYDAMLSGKGRDVCGRVLDELFDYAKTHFALEERLMEANNYAKTAEHKAEHAHLVKKVSEFKIEYDLDISLTVNTSLLTFLRDWLINHIAKSDKLLVASIPNS